MTDDATSQGLYVLLDMHQDAWSKFTFSLPSDNCEFQIKVGMAHPNGLPFMTMHLGVL
ncbi:MAG: hypothetical protein IPN09_04600 [Bacteroidetes bacterium]|nr:hypothetical protein [Bacteroidota bacterium]